MSDELRTLARWHSEHLARREYAPPESEERFIARSNLLHARDHNARPTVEQVDKEVERMHRCTAETRGILCWKLGCKS